MVKLFMGMSLYATPNVCEGGPPRQVPPCVVQERDDEAVHVHRVVTFLVNAFPGDVVRRGAGDVPGALVDVQCIPCMSGTKLPFQGKCSGGAQLVGGRCRERQKNKKKLAHESRCGCPGSGKCEKTQSPYRIKMALDLGCAASPCPSPF